MNSTIHKKVLFIASRIYCGAFILAALPLASQELLVYEDFELTATGGSYSEGALEGQAQADPTSAGFSSGWSTKAFDGSRTIVPNGLNYTDGSGAILTTAEGSLQLLPGARAERSLDANGALGDYSLFGSIGLVTGETLYISYLMKHDLFDGPSSEFGNEVAIFGLSSSTDTAINVFANTPTAQDSFGSDQYFIRPYNNNDLNTAIGPTVPDETHLFVVKIEFVEGADNDIVSVYLDPVLSSEDANTPGAVFDEGDMTFNQLSLGRFNGFDDNGATFDELRMGSTWESVTPYEGGGGTSEWAGYLVDENGDANTQAFLGWLRIYPDTGWIYSYALTKFMYLPESNVLESGAWSYVPR